MAVPEQREGVGVLAAFGPGETLSSPRIPTPRASACAATAAQASRSTAWSHTSAATQNRPISSIGRE